MATDRTVLEHLLGAREALALEVERLTSAIDELDSVIARVGASQFARGGVPAGDLAAAALQSSASRTTAAKATTRARKSPAKKALRASHADGSKSIRVHVLEMLEAENRDFELAEIIDRIHRQGIQAHDDAVRSITIKLMKDGRVERVGRGRYRLARRGAAVEPEAPPTPAQESQTPQAFVAPAASAQPAVPISG